MSTPQPENAQTNTETNAPKEALFGWLKDLTDHPEQKEWLAEYISQDSSVCKLIYTDAILEARVLVDEDLHERVLNETPLFHVFRRTMDPECSDYDPKRAINMVLVKSFVTERAAAMWIRKNAKKWITDSSKRVFTIMRSINTGDRDFESEAPSLVDVAGTYAPSFAFNEEGYQILLKEWQSREDFEVPYWVTVINGDNEFRGVKPIDFIKEFSKRVYKRDIADDVAEFVMDDFHKFQTSPDQYYADIEGDDDYQYY